MNDLVVVRLLQNPLGQEAPVGHRGDIVRVSDGRAALYLFPWEFETTDEARLRWLLAQQPSPAKSGDGTDSTENTDVRRLDGAELRARLARSRPRTPGHGNGEQRVPPVGGTTAGLPVTSASSCASASAAHTAASRPPARTPSQSARWDHGSYRRQR
jgi:hypothetical protein